MNEHKDDNEKGSQIDADLIKAFQTGDDLAFDKLVMRHKDRIFNLSFRFLGDYQEAEDITQDIFIKVYVSLKRFRFESAFSTWLYRVSVNTCTNRLKSQSYRRLKKNIQLIDDKEQLDVTLSPTLSDKPETPDKQLEKNQRMVSIKKAIDTLPVKQKTLVVLRDIEGLSYDEITKIAGIKPGTLKSRLARARLSLREKLKDVI